MLAIGLKTINKIPNLTIDSNTLITMEFAIQIPQKEKELNIEWYGIVVELDFKKGTTHTAIQLEIPDGSQTLTAKRQGSSMNNVKPVTIIPYTTNHRSLEMLTEVDTIEYSLVGGLSINSDELNIQGKNRLILTDCHKETALPWSPLEACRATFSDKPKPPTELNYSQTPEFDDNPRFIIENEYSNTEVDLDSNLLFSFKVVNKGTHTDKVYSLIQRIKPTYGVELMVVSSGRASYGTKVGDIITSDNPGLFVFPDLEIKLGSTIIQDIILRIVSAPLGISMIENTIEIENDQEIIDSSSCIKRINITSPNNNNEIRTQLLESIAKEEAGIAHLLSTEADKIRKVLSLSEDIDSIVNTNNSVHETLKEIIKYHILLEYKLEEALKLEV